jgi:Fe-S cluster biogenesis protein NfuA
MSGGCQGCAASTATLKQGIERILREHFGQDINEIIDVTDHGSGDNPYYTDDAASPFN